MPKQPDLNRGGRPALPATHRRTHAVCVRFTAAELVHLRSRADASGARSVAALVRAHLDRVPEALPDQRHDGVELRRDLRRIGANLNQAVRALHSREGLDDDETLEALRRAGDAVVRRLEEVQ